MLRDRSRRKTAPGVGPVCRASCTRVGLSKISTSTPSAEDLSASSALLRAQSEAEANRNARTRNPKRLQCKQSEKKGLLMRMFDPGQSSQILGKHPVIVVDEVPVFRGNGPVSLGQGVFENQLLDLCLKGNDHNAPRVSRYRRSEAREIAGLGVSGSLSFRSPAGMARLGCVDQAKGGVFHASVRQSCERFWMAGRARSSSARSAPGLLRGLAHADAEPFFERFAASFSGRQRPAGLRAAAARRAGSDSRSCAKRSSGAARRRSRHRDRAKLGLAGADRVRRSDASNCSTSPGCRAAHSRPGRSPRQGRDH